MIVKNVITAYPDQIQAAPELIRTIPNLLYYSLRGNHNDLTLQGYNLSGVYFFCQEGEVFYVGQSKVLGDRISWMSWEPYFRANIIAYHRYIDITSAYFLLYADNKRVDLIDIETAFIRYLQPNWNTLQKYLNPDAFYDHSISILESIYHPNPLPAILPFTEQRSKRYGYGKRRITSRMRRQEDKPIYRPGMTKAELMAAIEAHSALGDEPIPT